MKALAKIYMSISFAATIQSNLAFVTEVYKANETESENKQDLRKCARLNLRICKAIFILIVVTCLTFAVVPILTYLFTGRIEPILPLVIPFIRNDTIVGYMVQTIYQLILLFVGICLMAAPDVFLVTMTMQYWPMTQILDRSVRDLNKTNKETNRNSTWLRMSFRNIVLMHKQIYQ